MIKHSLFVAIALLLSVSVCRADWLTARGNPQRTGCTDGKPGPVRGGKVAWKVQSNDNFVGSMSPGAGLLYVPAMGAMNTGMFYAYCLEATPGKQLAWGRTAENQPSLKLPSISAPAVAGDKIYFGDGMHQHQSPTLYCLDAKGGDILWTLFLPGPLLHIEGTPTVVEKNVYLAAGDGGVLCVDTTQFTLNGKPIDPAAMTELRAKAWKELQARYEADKKKDPDFAVPPSQEQLPRAMPRIAWQRGAKQGGDKAWHVDAPIAVVGQKVLAASAFLEAEKTGDRAVFCMNAADGAVQWRVETRLNPWGGPSVAGDLVVVGCSNIRLDPNEIPEGKGEVIALALGDGAVKWRYEVPAGGVVSPVAISADKKLALFTATDKKVRALDLATGQEKWVFENKTPYFAGVAIAGELAYAADLNGVVQAINLADGKLAWKLDVNRETKLLGNIYGAPVIQGGRLYVATCNVQAARPNVVVCIEEK